jgi:hypothetical protein
MDIRVESDRFQEQVNAATVGGDRFQVSRFFDFRFFPDWLGKGTALLKTHSQ